MKELLDADGENRAVRCFLLLYGGVAGLDVPQMREYLEACGYPLWPEWVNGDRGYLTKAGAQAWIRYLFSLEPQ